MNSPHSTGNMFRLGFAAMAMALTLVGAALMSDSTPAQAAVVSNAAAITIPAAGTAGPASPYPSQITYPGSGETIVSMTVTLNGFTHAFPDDVDVLLVGPTGTSLIIMSDVGGSTDISANVTIDDAAAGQLPDGNVLIPTGSYQVTNIGAGDPFAAPAPAPGAGTALSVFNGTDPAGTWSLYVVDDLAGDIGALSGGWSIDVTVAAAATATPTHTATATSTGTVVVATGTATEETAPKTHTPTPEVSSTPEAATEVPSAVPTSPPVQPSPTVAGGGVSPIAPPDTGSGGYR